MNMLLLVLATVAHLAPHPFGVSSVGATALYAGAYGPNKLSWAVPVLMVLVGNLIFGFYDLTVLGFVYAGFALSTLSGRWLLRRGRSKLRYATAIALGAAIFFVTSNFAVWLVGMYPPTAAGLAQCYIRGLPFLGQAMLVDAAYCIVLFGLHSLVERRNAEPAIA